MARLRYVSSSPYLSYRVQLLDRRYRAARRVARKSRSDASPALYAIEMCRNLDREVGPTTLKSKAEVSNSQRCYRACWG